MTLNLLTMPHLIIFVSVYFIYGINSFCYSFTQCVVSHCLLQCYTVTSQVVTVTHCELTEQGCGQLSKNGGKLNFRRTYHPFTPTSTLSSSLSISKASFCHSQFQTSASNPRKQFSTFSSLLNAPLPRSLQTTLSTTLKKMLMTSTTHSLSSLVSLTQNYPMP